MLWERSSRPRCTRCLRNVLAVLALALLAFSPPAHAKEAARALVCGLDGCADAHKPGGVYAGSPGDSMPPPGPYYRIELFYREMTGHPVETIFYVPEARATAVSWDGRYLWSEPPQTALNAFDRITRGLRPYRRPVFDEVTIGGIPVRDPRSSERLLTLRDSGPTRLGESDWQLVELRSRDANPWSLSIVRYSPGSRILSRSLEWVRVPPRLAGAIESRSSLEGSSRDGFAWPLVAGSLIVAFGLALAAVLLTRRSGLRAGAAGRHTSATRMKLLAVAIVVGAFGLPTRCPTLLIEDSRG